MIPTLHFLTGLLVLGLFLLGARIWSLEASNRRNEDDDSQP
jgi:cbb3-type cytochrome oxidase subunit 3